MLAHYSNSGFTADDINSYTVVNTLGLHLGLSPVARGRSGVLRTVFWRSHNRQGALWCVARATGSRSDTWPPELILQKLKDTTGMARFAIHAKVMLAFLVVPLSNVAYALLSVIMNTDVRPSVFVLDGKVLAAARKAVSSCN